MSDSGGVKLRSNYKTHFTLETVPTATILETELVALDRAQQAQERSEAPFHHRRLLEASYSVVMS